MVLKPELAFISLSVSILAVSHSHVTDMMALFPLWIN